MTAQFQFFRAYPTKKPILLKKAGRTWGTTKGGEQERDDPTPLPPLEIHVRLTLPVLSTDMHGVTNGPFQGQ